MYNGWKDQLAEGASRIPLPWDGSLDPGWVLDTYGPPTERNDWVVSAGGHGDYISGSGVDPEIYGWEAALASRTGRSQVSAPAAVQPGFFPIGGADAYPGATGAAGSPAAEADYRAQAARLGLPPNVAPYAPQAGAIADTARMLLSRIAPPAPAPVMGGAPVAAGPVPGLPDVRRFKRRRRPAFVME